MSLNEIIIGSEKRKFGIDADIENLEKRLRIQKEWVAKTESELESLKEQKKREDVQKK